MEEQTSLEAASKAASSKGKKNRGFGKGFIVGVIVMALIAGALHFGENMLRNGKGNQVLDSATSQKVRVLSELIQEYYYEDVDIEDLQDGVLHGLFENLDVYSRYYTPEEYEKLYSETVSGTYCGIGASLQQDPDTKDVRIVHVYADSPAEKAGLQDGDMIVSADDYQSMDMELTEFVSHIRGEEGTSVHLLIYRKGKEMEFDITRENLQFPTVEYEMMAGKTGYIDVSEFTDSTPEQYEKALADLSKQGMDALIIDLRSNPGGMLDSCVEMLDDILPEGLLVYTETKNGTKEEYKSTDDKSMDLPLVVLVDGNSASASEIFAGAIQDREAGTILGTTTFGKGVVQSLRSLNDGSGFKVTTSRYFTPNGTCIHGIGITPDVELQYEFLGGEDESYSHDLDNQIQKALEILVQ